MLNNEDFSTLVVKSFGLEIFFASWHAQGIHQIIKLINEWMNWLLRWCLRCRRLVGGWQSCRLSSLRWRRLASFCPWNGARIGLHSLRLQKGNLFEGCMQPSNLDTGEKREMKWDREREREIGRWREKERKRRRERRKDRKKYKEREREKEGTRKRAKKAFELLFQN